MSESRFNLELLTAPINDANRDQWLANWQSAIDAGLLVISKPDVDLADLVWLAGLFNLFRDAGPRVIDDRRSLVQSINDNCLRYGSFELRRKRGRGENTDQPRRFTAGNQLANLVDNAVYAKKYSADVDQLLNSAQLLYDQTARPVFSSKDKQPLIAMAIQAYRETAPNKRLKGDNERISILINWLEKGKFDTNLGDDAFCGWRDGRGLRFYNYCRYVNRKVKQYRGAKRPKGEPLPSWILSISSYSNFRHSNNDPTDKGREPNQYTRARIATQHCIRRGIIPADNYGRINIALAFRTFREVGIKQTTIKRWLNRIGIDSVYPEITALAKPVCQERTEHGISVTYYAILSFFNGRFGHIVWREGMSDVIHVNCISATEAIDQSIEAINRRAEADRREKEERRLAELSKRQQLANLLRRCRSIPQLRKEDSYSVGNCHPGTESFVRQLGLGDRDVVNGKDIANRWRKNSYCQQSYFQRVILAFPVNQLVVTNGETE